MSATTAITNAATYAYLAATTAMPFYWGATTAATTYAPWMGATTAATTYAPTANTYAPSTYDFAASTYAPSTYAPSTEDYASTTAATNAALGPVAAITEIAATAVTYLQYAFSQLAIAANTIVPTFANTYASTYAYRAATTYCITTYGATTIEIG